MRATESIEEILQLTFSVIQRYQFYCLVPDHNQQKTYLEK